MSATKQLNSEPTQFRAGEIVEWPKSLSAYSAADGWSLFYRLVNESNAYTAIEGTADGTGFVITIPAATTANYVAGKYALYGWVSKSAELYEVYNAECEVLVDLKALTAGYDIRPHVKKVLDALEAVIEGRASEKEKTVSIGGQTIDMMTLAELRIEWNRYNKYYQDYLAEQRINAGKPSGRKILLRFDRAS